MLKLLSGSYIRLFLVIQSLAKEGVSAFYRGVGAFAGARFIFGLYFLRN